MKYITTLILLFGLLGVQVFADQAPADQAHPSKQFEAMLISCMPGGTKGNNCLVETILKFTKNNSVRDKMPGVIGGLIDTILGSRKVFAIHPVQSKTLGDFIKEVSYIIEKDDGGFALLQVAFLKTLGSWQVHNVSLSSKDETIDAELDVNI